MNGNFENTLHRTYLSKLNVNDFILLTADDQDFWLHLQNEKQKVRR